MINGDFGWLAIGLPLVGFASYFRDTVTGRAQPNWVSWALWTMGPAVAFTAELARSVPLRTAAVTLALGVGPACILVASLARRPKPSRGTAPRRRSWRQIRRILARSVAFAKTLDGACLAFGLAALAALAAGAHSRSATAENAAIALAIAADICAAVPTIRKAWRSPQTETVGTYMASGAGSVILLLTLPRPWVFADYGFALYATVVCSLIVALVAPPAVAAWARKARRHSHARHRRAAGHRRGVAYLLVQNQKRMT